MSRHRKRKKYVSSLIIRLIDVVLILLFGFIAISEISKKSKIKLAESTSVPATAPDRESVVYIGVLPDGRYLIDDERRSVRSLNALAQYLRNERIRLNRKNSRMRVRVRSNHDAKIEYVFAAVRLCQNQNVPVGLEVIKKTR